MGKFPAAPLRHSGLFCHRKLPGVATRTTPVWTHMPAFFRAIPAALFIHIDADTSTFWNLFRRRTPLRRARKIIVHVLYLFVRLLPKIRLFGIERDFTQRRTLRRHRIGQGRTGSVYCIKCNILRACSPTFETIRSENETDMRRAR
jgi:hypothetical protein